MREKTKKGRIDKAVRGQSRVAKEVSRAVHAAAERPFREVESSRRMGEYLGANGFQVAFPFKNIPTAFRAIWGSGKPAIGMLGEYDALPNCGAEEGTWGHG